MPENHSPESEDPDKRNKRESEPGMLIVASAVLDLDAVLAEHGQDGALTSSMLVSALAATAKVVIALTR